MKDKSPVCRVCSAQDGVFLDLFGSETQKVSYAEDVIRCLSCEVKTDDGLSQKICVKCVGSLSEIKPFVDRVLGLGREKVSRKSSTDDTCYYCLSSENHLFPIPKASLSKTKDCFEIDVSPSENVCHRCQFHLDTLHELKSKAYATSTQFSTDSRPVKEVISKKEDTVDDLVSSLKNRYKMNKPGKSSEQQTLVAKLQILDVGVAVGGDFFSKGTVSVSEFWDALASTSIKRLSVKGKKPGPVSSKTKNIKPGPVSSKTKNIKPGPVSSKINKGKPSPNKSKAAKAGPLSSKKNNEDNSAAEESESSKDDVQNIPIRNLKNSEFSTPASEKRTRRGRPSGNKSFKEDSFDTDSPPKKSISQVSKAKRPREISESEDEIYTKKRTRNSSTSPRGNVKSNSVSTRPRRFSSMSASEESDLPGSPEKKKRGRRPKVTSDEAAVAIAPSEEETTEEMEEEANNSSVDKENEGPKSKRRGGRSFKKYFNEEEDEDEDDPSDARKRKRRQSSDFEADSGLDEEPPISKSKREETETLLPEVDQPEFLKELDELLKLTPKSTFRPFICSVCHEGYISTVKGKLHKLVVHDPHSNIVIKLARCDEESEVERLKSLIQVQVVSLISENKQDGEKNLCNGNDSDDSENDLWQSSSKKTDKAEKSFDELLNSRQEPESINNELGAVSKDNAHERADPKESDISQEDTEEESEAVETAKSGTEEERDDASEGEGIESQEENSKEITKQTEVGVETDSQEEEEVDEQEGTKEVEKGGVSENEDNGEDASVAKVKEENKKNDDDPEEEEKEDEAMQKDAKEKEKSPKIHKNESESKSESSSLRCDEEEESVSHPSEVAVSDRDNKSPVSTEGGDGYQKEEDETKASEADVESNGSRDDEQNCEDVRKRETDINGKEDKGAGELGKDCSDFSEEESNDRAGEDKEAVCVKNCESLDESKEDSAKAVPASDANAEEAVVNIV